MWFRLFLIAKRDYLASVRTKAFLFGLILGPLLFGGSFLGVAFMKRSPDVAGRRIAIVDETGLAAPSVISELQTQNQKARFNKITGTAVMPLYRFETVPFDPRHAEAQHLELSDRVRSKDLFAFLEIGAKALKPDKHGETDSGVNGIEWYSNEGGFDEALRWFSGPLNDGLRRVRLARLGIASDRLDEMLSAVPVDNFNLVVSDPKTGQIVRSGKKANLQGVAAPLVLAMLLFMIVMGTAAPMLSGVAQDKMQRVYEMLLASASSFEIMAGKILAAICIALTSGVFYIVGALAALQALALVGLTPLAMLPWFFIYVVAEVFTVSALPQRWARHAAVRRRASN